MPGQIRQTALRVRHARRIAFGPPAFIAAVASGLASVVAATATTVGATNSLPAYAFTRHQDGRLTTRLEALNMKMEAMGLPI
jgi:hypothetical protein